MARLHEVLIFKIAFPVSILRCVSIKSVKICRNGDLFVFMSMALKPNGTPMDALMVS